MADENASSVPHYGDKSGTFADKSNSYQPSEERPVRLTWHTHGGDGYVYMDGGLSRVYAGSAEQANAIVGEHNAVAEREQYLAGIIRELREKLWFRTGYSAAHEREWEDEDREASREAGNRERKAVWDAETERLIGGTP